MGEIMYRSRSLKCFSYAQIIIAGLARRPKALEPRRPWVFNPSEPQLYYCQMVAVRIDLGPPTAHTEYPRGS